ncbi:outer membrane beta-barrel protein [Flavobacterium okayamense]|uniref:Flavo-specific protein antigen FspA n=1 Tax=Flavobacterium okayamense TaxID=2830782 RepID=A0ABM7SA75_9FLAO|nr:outer membrane beta-barrel protein [Flavobacterium okayamense]BCY29667.1 flavo-specific protein antigen FspA [Flavobacterium okayamense]
MKKVLLSAVAILGFTFANAQEEETTTNGGFAQGDVFVTGAVTFSSSSMDEDKSSSFEIAPQVGFFLTENIAIGGKIAYMSEKAESFSVDTEDMSGFGVGAFGRYYFTPANQFSLFGQLAVDYASMEDKLADYKVNAFGAGLGFGMNYFVSSNFSIEAGVGVLNFASAKADVDGAEALNTFSFGGDWRAVTFGVNYKF